MSTDTAPARIGLFAAPSTAGLALWRLDGDGLLEVAHLSDDRTPLASLSRDGTRLAVVDVG